MKKIVEELERGDLVEPTHSDGAAPSLLVPKKLKLSLGCRLSWSEQTNKENNLAFTTNKEFIDSLEVNMYHSNIDLLSGYLQMALEEKSQNLTTCETLLGMYK